MAAAREALRESFEEHRLVGTLFTDPAGRVLIVKPNYRDPWLLVGGVVDEGETPEQACRREVKEEIGIDLPAGRLLLVDWAPPSPYRPLPLIEFIFDGGVIKPDQVQFDNRELDEYRFLPPNKPCRCCRCTDAGD